MKLSVNLGEWIFVETAQICYKFAVNDRANLMLNLLLNDRANLMLICYLIKQFRVVRKLSRED